MGSSSTVTACMSQVDYLLLLDLLSFDPPPELLVFLAPTPKLLLFTKKWISLKRPGAACSVKKCLDALLWHPARRTACKGLCTLAGRRTYSART
ncbi:unnamed protein product [Brassica oleracea]